MKIPDRKCHLWLLYAPITTAIILSGCMGDDGIVLPVEPYDSLLIRAWSNFNAGLYDEAIASFDEAVDMDPLNPDAYLGLGWCYAMLDDMESSLSNFGIAISRDSGSADGHASRAFIYLAQNSYETAIEEAQTAIALGGEEYIFEQIPDVRTRNLRLLMAECYYAVGNYPNAQAQVDILNPDNNLDQNSRTYKENLLLEIESLRSVEPVLEGLTN